MRITQNQAQQIRDVPHFRDSHYAAWDLQGLINFYNEKLVKPYSELLKRNSIAADIGCGYGWLSICIALNTGATVYAVEPDEARLHAAMSIGEILGVGEKIIWVVGSVDSLPFMEVAIDVVYCVEVIEHVKNSPLVISELSAVCRNALIITTPNTNPG